MLALVGLALGGCSALSPSSPQPAGNLQLEEHPLGGAPQLDPLTFQPIEGTQEQLLATHATDRAMTIPREVITVEGNPAISSLGESGDLVATLITATEGEPEQTVRLWRGDELIFETAAGLPSPAMPLQGLWTYGGHWALEILLADQDTWAGQVFIDGDLVNESQGYDEAFGLQLLAGRPFFFYLRNGHVGYSLDGQETDLDYTEIPHYRCCSESSLNPVQAQNMVAFFAARNQTWFYVELGDFDG